MKFYIKGHELIYKKSLYAKDKTLFIEHLYYARKYVPFFGFFVFFFEFGNCLLIAIWSLLFYNTNKGYFILNLIHAKVIIYFI